MRSLLVAHHLHSNRRAAIFRDRWSWQKHTYRSRYSSLHAAQLDKSTSNSHKMRWLLSITVAFLWSVVVVQAKSFTGNRLLVVLEEQAEREKYSVFLEDLTCKSIDYFNSFSGQCHVSGLLKMAYKYGVLVNDADQLNMQLGLAPRRMLN